MAVGLCWLWRVGLFDTATLCQSVCHHLAVILDEPNGRLRSHYLLITPNPTATGSPIRRRPECKSVTFVLTLFVAFLFSAGWWHIKCSPGDCGNLVQYGNRGADGYFSSHQTLFFCLFMSSWRLNYIDGLIGYFRPEASEWMNGENQLSDH